eukprot:TRINITY_DN14310_c0_g1_i11.p1 TRINITY_DN14310_c0_g1~~TRINITY_DN14310_c0_g1_i11.p1  ORF type:complete len:744 (-),score=153.62 TRINITY_DN14310_c0_g1_i11:169-2118(-)
MTTTDTRDVAATVEQVKRCADAGADLVRITVQGKKEAAACAKIREALFKDNYYTPLVADIHFQPGIAMLVADAFEKIRINPGNFVDGAKKFDNIIYDDESQFEEERQHIEEVFTPLVLKCKELNRAMRIGTNHGSLSARILSFYGDTPRGMVESAFEFAEVCRKHDYHNFLFSMKASNPLVMVQAYRLLAEEMYNRGWDYPMHLGVTEAGEGEDGRMKSSIGIGSLLMDGLGDTIRVSLTEDPEYEIDPCSRLANMGTDVCKSGLGVEPFQETKRDIHTFSRREGDLPVQQEKDGEHDYRGLLNRDGTVISAISEADLKGRADVLYSKLGCKLAVGMPFKDIATSDTILVRQLPASSDTEERLTLKRLQEVGVNVLVPLDVLTQDPMPNAVALLPLTEALKDVNLPEGCQRYVVTIDGTETNEQLASLKSLEATFALLCIKEGVSRMHASRRVFEQLAQNNITLAVIHHLKFGGGESVPQPVRDEIIIKSGSELGGLLVDGLGDGVMLECETEDLEFLRLTSFGLLQGCRMRNIKTEYVSCPSCGRTLFDLQEVTDQIRIKTGHLPGVAIAVMGCIVNGPGEMADADFGYVGGAPGKIDLYVKKDVVKKGVPMDKATDELIQLIKDHGRWVEPPEIEEFPEVEQEAVTA